MSKTISEREKARKLHKLHRKITQLNKEIARIDTKYWVLATRVKLAREKYWKLYSS